jgi:hypothetical protein
MKMDTFKIILELTLIYHKAYDKNEMYEKDLRYFSDELALDSIGLYPAYDKEHMIKSY